MKSFLQFLITTSVCVALTLSFVTLHNASVELDRLEGQLDDLTLTLDQVDYVTVSTYEEAVNESLIYAPKGYTRWQLRGHAQKAAQESLNKLTDKHKLPRYELPGIRWAGILETPTAAGQATNCFENGRHTPKHSPYRGHIKLNELLFFRNYNEYIYIVIPHEVSHVFVCLNGGFVYDDNETDWQAEHGPEWERAMKELGFISPEKFKTHLLDLAPVFNYGNTLIERTLLYFENGDKNVSEE